ncbi:hypothetical protein BHS06_11490 [Myxococcus xanthus]|uniref:hypothetical protein n=1 Tax=Myxococcus xanthus TaxID=34 RepID=UPI0011653217|nr:hypothetical protein [Myxococcus xanthus]QDE89532.1 hypothetical protein BHS06_11490 [Myxococcus xanthus]
MEALNDLKPGMLGPRYFAVHDDVEIGQGGAYRQIGHDGGPRVRAHLLFKDTLAGDTRTFVYFTNGSARNVWSRTLVDSTMARRRSRNPVARPRDEDLTEPSRHAQP